MTGDPVQSAITPLSAAKSSAQLGDLLRIRAHELTHCAYGLPARLRYRAQAVPKVAGLRDIASPHPRLREVQTKLLPYLTQSYGSRVGVHGYVKTRSIITNALQHEREQHVLNLDLVNFFGTITFNRVRGILKSDVYGLSEEVANLVAQLCCFNGTLPQGAPTSPIISNMVCGKMDAQLRSLSRKYGCTYTRFSDDISISSGSHQFPIELASFGLGGNRQVRLGEELVTILRENSFIVNTKKTRLQSRSEKQMVTGLVVNDFVNIPRPFIRSVRAALHKWRKFGYLSACAEFGERYDLRKRRSADLHAVLFGRIQFVGAVRGFDDALYRKLRQQFNELSTANRPIDASTEVGATSIVLMKQLS